MRRSRCTRGLLRETPVKEQEEGTREPRGEFRSWVQTCCLGAEKGGEEARGREATAAGRPGGLLGQVCGAPGHEDLLEGSQEGQKWSGSGTHCAGLSAGSTPESGL